MKKLFLLVACVFFTLTTSASHLLGGYIQVMQVGTSDTLNVSAVLFSDPQGIGLPTTLTLNEYKLTNGFYQSTTNVSMTQTTTGTWQGVNVAMWSATIIRTAGDYRWIYTNCCRGIHTNASSSMNSSFTMGLDYQKSSTPNTAPILLNLLPVNGVVGDTAQSILFAVDPDGDSVMIEKDDALNQYANGTFVPLSPFSQLGNYGSYFVSTNGLVSWNPNTQGTFGTGYKISEYRNGSLIGLNRVQQVYSVVQGSTPSISAPFNMTFNADSTVTIEHDLLDGDSLYVGFTASNITHAQLFIYGVPTIDMSTTTWSMSNLQVGTWEGFLRVFNGNCLVDYPLSFEVTSTIGIEENIANRNMKYEVYDWYGKYMGTTLENQKGFRILRYENGKVEKVFIQ